MNLFANPIFLTQKRLAHRSGVLAPVLIAVLIGLSLLAALAYNLQRGLERGDLGREEAGHVFYAWLLVLQALTLVIGGFSKLTRTLVEERREGLLDSNRLTPLASRDLVTGYWLAAWMREVYIAAALAPVGLAMVLMAQLPVTLWLGTQALLVSTALFFGLLGMLVGMALRRPLGGVAALAVLPLLLMLTGGGRHLSLTNFLLPLHATMRLFDGDAAKDAPQLFGLSVPSLVYTWGIQILFGVLLWRGAVRKFADPFRPALTRGQSVTVFGLMVLLQHGLIWSVHSSAAEWSNRGLFSLVHAGTILLGLVILGSHGLKPERARIEALRLGDGRARWVIQHSGPCLALALMAVATGIMLTQFVGNAAPEWPRYLIAAVNLATVYLSFALLLEICRISFRRRAIGFLALGLFVLYVLPYVLGMAFMSQVPARFSFFTPGVAAFATQKPEEVANLIPATIAHVVVIAVLGYFWLARWRGWLEQTMTTRQSSKLPSQ